MRKRARNPRVIAVEIMKDIKRLADTTRARWTVGTTVYEVRTETRTVDYGQGPVEQSFTNGHTRPRRSEEYPETQEEEWSALWSWADDMEKQAAALKALALKQWQGFGDNAQYTLVRKAEQA